MKAVSITNGCCEYRKKQFLSVFANFFPAKCSFYPVRHMWILIRFF